MATVTSTATLVVPVEKIHVPVNVRDLDAEHVCNLAGSIALQGLISPVTITPATGVSAEHGFEYELVAGFHRYAAVCQLGYGAIDAVLRAADTDEEVTAAAVASARATENVLRKQLTVTEEAAAVKAMLDRGLTEDGAAQALGWPRQRVTARMKLLELPDRAFRLVGQGVIPLSAVENLRAIAKVSAELLDVLVAFVATETFERHYTPGHLASDTGRVLGTALRETRSKAFAAYLQQVPHRAVDDLRLGKTAAAQLAQAEKDHRKLNQYAYGPPTIRFDQVEVDQARAAGVLIELDGSQPLIAERSLYRELCKQAISRTAEQLREQAQRLDAETRQAAKQHQASAPADPVQDARRQHARQRRQIAEQAHGANLDLGAALLTGLSTVDPADMTVARFFAYAVLGSDHDGSPYTQSGERVADLAMRGIRLILDEFRTDVTKTLKSGERGKLRIDYGDPKKPEKAITWLWKYIDGARTAGELYGRVLVVIAAEQHACRLVLPVGQRGFVNRWPSHNGHAAKALAKLAGPHLPASLTAIEKAIEKADREMQAAQNAARTKARKRASAAPRREAPADADPQASEPGDVDQDEDLDDEDE